MLMQDEIRLLRQKAFMTQADFSGKLGVSVITINRWENGKSVPNLRAMKKLHDFCEESGLSFRGIEAARFGPEAAGMRGRAALLRDRRMRRSGMRKTGLTAEA